MSTPLQKTKLFRPTPRPQLVERERLLDLLDGLRADGCRAGLISAPAGAGKTTVVVQWLNRLNWPAGWVSLDTRDNQPGRFFGYLISALQTAMPGVGDEALALLQLPGVDLEEIVTLLVNDLATYSGPFVLVLDDFHTITNPLLHRAVSLLLEAQPPWMRLVLLSREDPALQLARLRARGQLVELRQEDLRFSLPEAIAFLNHGMGLSLSTHQVEMLEARTEGWIAGLQMAALSLQRTTDIARFIQEFSGSQRFILDYLMEEVLAQQPEEIQNFLLETSLLERMCAELCAAVTGKTSLAAQKLLEYLAKANLFVIPLDEERRWYRYHHLFGDLLLHQLQRENPQRAAALFRSASDWYEDNGDPRLAVEYALKAKLPRQAARLIERHSGERWQTVDLEFFFLVNRLPKEVVAERPSLCLNSAWICVITGQTDLIPGLLEAAESRLTVPDRLPEPEDMANRAFARALRVYLADIENQPVELNESLEQAVTAIPEENTGMRNSIAVVVGTICYMEGNFERALAYYEDALERDKGANGTNAVPISVMRIVWVFQVRGKLRPAADLLVRYIDYVNQRGNRRYYISGILNILLGEIFLEWNQLDQAEAQILEGLHLLEDWPIPQVLSLGLSLLARLQTARGDFTRAAASFERVDGLMRQFRFYPEFIHRIDQNRLRLWVAEKNQTALENWAGEHAKLASLDLRFRYESDQIGLCRAWLALGRKEEAAGLLLRLAGSTGERDGSRVVILLLLVTALSNQREQAMAFLGEALRLGESQGYLRVFLDAGEPIQQALRAWLQSSRSKKDTRLDEYAQGILTAFGKDAPAHSNKTVRTISMIEPLSEREQEVLLLVAKGLTNQQIAERLVISIRTVKKHVENIHGKLGVQNRTQAVARAREAGLLNG